MFTRFLSALALVGLFTVNAQNPCDDAYGAHCPEEAGWSVGECLNKVSDPGAISDKCAEFIQMHNSCRDEIESHCKGNEYTGDVLPCLTEWTNSDLISAACSDSFPKKEEKREKKKSKSDKRKADKRRKIRNKAANMAREL